MMKGKGMIKKKGREEARYMNVRRRCEVDQE